MAGTLRWSPPLVLFSLSALTISGCSGDGTGTDPRPVEPAVIRIVSGDGQSASVGSALEQPLTVRVSAADGDPAPNVSVSWSAPEVVSLSAATTSTDAAGRASVTLTVGTIAGSHAVTASVQGVEESAAFTAHALPGPLATFAVDPTEVTVGTWGESTTLAPIAEDEYGNRIPEAPVTWTSSDTAIVRVVDAGELRSWLPGEATVTAAIADLEATATVTVARQPNADCQVSDPRPLPGPAGGAVPTLRWHESFGGPPMEYLANFHEGIDLTGDGIDEVVAFSATGSWTVDSPEEMEGHLRAWQKVDGRWDVVTAERLSGEFDVEGGPRAVAVADLNEDGIEDLWAVQHGWEGDGPEPGAHDILLLSQPDGTHADMAPTHLDPYDRGFTHSTAIGDVDCDGVDDLFQNNSGELEPHLQIHQGGGYFRAEDDRLPAFLFGAARETFQAATFIDFDLDGDADLVLGGWPPGSDVFRDRFLVNDGFGHFRALGSGALPEPPYGTGLNGMLQMKTLDADGDGLPDIILSATRASDGQLGQIAIWRNNGDGTFSDDTGEMLGTIPEWSSWIYRIKVTDLNDDGWDDFVLSWPSGAMNPHAYINRGGTFTLVTVPDYHQPVVPVFTDRSGVPDLVGQGPGEGVPDLIRNSGH